MYEVLQHLQIPNKLIRLVKATMDNMVAEVQVQTHMLNSTEYRWSETGRWLGTSAIQSHNEISEKSYSWEKHTAV
jgi:hypothetical protein